MKFGREETLKLEDSQDGLDDGQASYRKGARETQRDGTLVNTMLDLDGDLIRVSQRSSIDTYRTFMDKIEALEIKEQVVVRTREKSEPLDDNSELVL